MFKGEIHVLRDPTLNTLFLLPSSGSRESCVSLFLVVLLGLLVQQLTLAEL
jgi:hypothetical protein